MKAQLLITESFTVLGKFKIDLNQKNIKDALFVKGVKFADWDEKTRTLTVSFDPKKANIDDIHHRMDFVTEEKNAGTADANYPGSEGKNASDKSKRNNSSGKHE